MTTTTQQPPVNRAGVRNALLPLLLVCCGGCPEGLPPLPGGIPWTRHTIDNRFDGADGVKLGDANGDGWTDLVVPWEQTGVVVIYLNPGPARAASAWPAVTVGRVGDVEDAVFVDLDADGALDVVSCCQGDTKTMYVHWAPADPADYADPDAWQTVPLPATAGRRKWMFCQPAQIDGVRGIDLVAGAKGDDGRIGYLAAPDDPRDLAGWTWHPLVDAQWIMSILPGDLDADGDVDIVYTDRKGDARGAYWLENPGRGAVPALWHRHRIATADDEVMFMDLGDLDLDYQDEIVLATAGRQLLLYDPPSVAAPLGRTTPIAWSTAFGTGKGVRLGDINLDGAFDIVFTCENADDKFGVGWLSQRSIGGVSFWSAASISGTAGSKFDLVQLLDLDADGDLDVITTEESAGLGVIWYENPTVSR